MPQPETYRGHAMDAGDVGPLTGLATVSFDRGEYAEAREYVRESVEQTRDMRDLAFQIVQLEALIPGRAGEGHSR